MGTTNFVSPKMSRWEWFKIGFGGIAASSILTAAYAGILLLY